MIKEPEKKAASLGKKMKLFFINRGKIIVLDKRKKLFCVGKRFTQTSDEKSFNRISHNAAWGTHSQQSLPGQLLREEGAQCCGLISLDVVRVVVVIKINN
ncbi:CLUMA_CG007791, isoform A [Clunio marinus]|uniref:CLUMA_CG007791, isoform A n=1 Tax=Clunio marinus TaxID=568069 RepID=A0A1J1I3V0_9DIPT|nr:CLUMA_CG007791, isoform A [Clunio marinus]